MEQSAERAWKLFSWPRVGVVDVGSNAIRVTVAEVGNKEIIEIESHRFSLRLGKDVFASPLRTLSTETQANLVDIFVQIKKIFLENKVDMYRAVATAALRSARNRRQVLAKILKNSGIQLELINAYEEGRLIGASLPKSFFARQELLMDLGGGSLELAHYDGRVLKGMTSLPLGAVRLLGTLQKKNLGPDGLCRHIANICKKDPFFWRFCQKHPRNIAAVGSGGNIRALYRMRKKILHKNCSPSPHMSYSDLTAILQKLEGMTSKQREERLKLPRDRADVIVPAGYVFHEILGYLGVDKIHIPMTVSLRRGILMDLQEKLF